MAFLCITSASVSKQIFLLERLANQSEEQKTLFANWKRQYSLILEDKKYNIRSFNSHLKYSSQIAENENIKHAISSNEIIHTLINDLLDVLVCILFKCYLERTLVNDKYMFKTNLTCLTLTLRKCKTNKSHRENYLSCQIKQKFL